MDFLASGLISEKIVYKFYFLFIVIELSETAGLRDRTNTSIDVKLSSCVLGMMDGCMFSMQHFLQELKLVVIAASILSSVYLLLLGPLNPI